MICFILFLKIGPFQAFHTEQMEGRNGDETISAIRERNKRYKPKIMNQINQQRDNIIPDTFGLQENFIKHEVNDMNFHEMTDELPNQQ